MCGWAAVSGPAHATDVLLGSRSEKIERYGHESLSVYGIGKELKRDGWMELSRRLTASGYLENVPPYGVLAPTEKTRDFFKNGEKYRTRLIESNTRTKSKRSAYGDGEKVRGGDSAQQEAPEALFEALRSLRKALADEAKVPPYVVFPDRTLREMARQRPKSVEDLEGVFGVGAHKAERYGTAFVSRIRQWADERGE